MTQRPQFELWMSKQCQAWVNKLDRDGKYSSYPIQLAWEAWQASRQATLTETSVAAIICNQNIEDLRESEN